MPGTVLGAPYSFHLIVATLWGRCFSAHLINVEFEAQKMLWFARCYPVGRCLASRPALPHIPYSQIGELNKKAQQQSLGELFFLFLLRLL